MEINGSISEVSRMGSRPTQFILLNILYLNLWLDYYGLAHMVMTTGTDIRITSGFDSLGFDIEEWHQIKHRKWHQY